MMGRFPRCVNDLAFKEIYLNGWQYTWSNGQSPPTLVHLDACSARLIGKGLLANGVCHLRCLASIVSDHSPLLLDCYLTPLAHCRFYFKDFWLRLARFQDTVSEGWNSAHHVVARMQATANKLTELG
jgi:hypothetical protein